VKDLRAESNERVRSGVDEMTKKLEAKDRDIEILKKQASGLTNEYNNLADRYGAQTKSDSTPKKDQ
jgi:uncharacterized protein YoxC